MPINSTEFLPFSSRIRFCPMASPHLSSSRRSSSPSRSYRRSSFNGAKQLDAVGASSRRTLTLVGLLVVALVVTLGVVAYHLTGGSQ